jgi:hypothetical protein
MDRHASQAACSLLGVLEELDQLHRRHNQLDLGRHFETPGVSNHRGGWQLSRPSPETGDQRRVDVYSGDRVAAPRQMQRNPPGPTTKVQDRTIDPIRQLLPQPKVRGIGSALDVMPDDAHRQNSSVSPRPESTLCSSSKAV